jgi:hypothetical protein
MEDKKEKIDVVFDCLVQGGLFLGSGADGLHRNGGA